MNKLSLLLTTVAFAFLMVSSIFATKCSEISRQPQTQPSSYRAQDGSKASGSAFLAMERNHLVYNQEIPVVCEDALRVATYNVHFHKRIDKKTENTNDIRNDLKQLQPSVVVFQEVMSNGTSEKKSFDKMLDSAGYKYRVEYIQSGAFLGNMIASKFPIEKIATQDLIGHERNLIAVSLSVGDSTIAVLGTHLEVKSSATRVAQVKQIMEFIHANITNKYDNYILTGDMNAHWNSQEIQNLVTSGYLGEIFSIVNAPYPNYTCWAGTTIDFMFASEKLSSQLVGAYIYHTISSDHLPVLADIKLASTITVNTAEKDAANTVEKDAANTTEKDAANKGYERTTTTGPHVVSRIIRQTILFYIGIFIAVIAIISISGYYIVRRCRQQQCDIATAQP